MPRFHISNILPERDIASDTVNQYDMGVQPLSAILLNLRPLNDTGTLANYCNALRICQAVNRATLYYRGSAVISMRGEDIAAFNFHRWGMMVGGANWDNVDNERRSVTLPIILGRYPFMQDECFPAAGKGELQLELDLDAVDTGYDGLKISIDTVELPDGKPKVYEKRVQQTQTWAATGNNDIDLPVGNPIRGFFLWGTTGYDGATPAPSWGDVTVLKDNQEYGFRSVSWATLRTLANLWGRQNIGTPEDEHFHITTTDGNAQTAVSTLGGSGFNRQATYNNSVFLDFDPTGTDEFVMQTADARRVQIRANAGTADAVRCVPVEVLRV